MKRIRKTEAVKVELLKFVALSTMLVALITCANMPKKRYLNQESIDVDLSVNSDAKIVNSGGPLQYPAHALRAKVTGSVELVFVVSKTGKPREIQILKEEPHGYGFAGAAIRHVNSMEFKPAILDGKRVKQKLKRRYNFELN